MQIVKVRFDGQIFLLAPAQDVELTKQAILSAIREGSNFVDFATIGHGTISLLVSPNFPVRFETLERTEAEVAALTEHPPPIDRFPAFDWEY